MGHSQFKFKSSGFKTDDRRFTKKSRSASTRPIGIKTPLEEGDDIFKMHINPIRALTDNFRNLLMTNHGERLGKFDFGANLNSVVFEYSNSPNFEQLVSDAVINTTQKFIPAISITGVSTAITDISEKNDLNKLGLAKVTIRVEYIIPKFKSPNLAIEID